MKLSFSFFVTASCIIFLSISILFVLFIITIFSMYLRISVSSIHGIGIAIRT